MGEYKRLISYIYSYKNGIKDNNCGFARLEERDGICKINIMVKPSENPEGLGNEAYKVYFFQRYHGKVRSIYIDDIFVFGQGGELKKKIATEKLSENSEMYSNRTMMKTNIDELSGIFICPYNYENEEGKGIVFASEWDDIPIDVNDFKKKSDNDENNNILQDDNEIIYNDSNISHKEDMEGNIKVSEIAVEEVQPEECGCNADISNMFENIMKEMKKTEPKEAEDKPSEILEKKDEEVDFCVDRQGPQIKDYFKMLCGCYPKVKIDEIDGECIKITPHDISYLPKKYWQLCNNSFLLHGYYNYKYLLLCEKVINKDKKYFVAVPGLFHQKEQKVARMFGFTDFEGDKEPGMMKFGYWCMYL